MKGKWRPPRERKPELKFGEHVWKFTQHREAIESALERAMQREYGKYAGLFDAADMSRDDIQKKARRRIIPILRGFEEGDIGGYAYAAFRTAIFKEALRAIDYSKKQRKILTELQMPKVITPEEAFRRKEIREIIEREMKTLSEEDRAFFVDYLDKLGSASALKEMAEKYGVKESAVKKRIFKIRSKLRQNPALNELWGQNFRKRKKRQGTDKK
jgi:RNA polymerase sigma factor (sigma-70 family)